MKRLRSTKLLRYLVAALVALASVGPRATYAHSHSVAEDGHHSHEDPGAAAHDEHEDDHDGPGLSESFAHVHGSWLGFAITFATAETAAASENRLFSTACPTLSADLGSGLFGPLKERIPWPDRFNPPEPFHLSRLACCSSSNPFLDGTGTPYALSVRTVVLRC